MYIYIHNEKKIIRYPHQCVLTHQNLPGLRLRRELNSEDQKLLDTLEELPIIRYTGKFLYICYR